MTGSLIFAAVVLALFAWFQTYRVGKSIFDRAGRRGVESPGSRVE